MTGVESREKVLVLVCFDGQSMNRRPTLDPTLSPLVKRPMSSPSAPSTPLATGGKKRLSLSTGLAASGTGAKKLLLKAKRA